MTNKMQNPCSDSPSTQLNLNIRGLAPSATVTINDLSNQLQKEGRKVYKLGLGQSPFPVPDPVVNELRLNAHQKAYLPVRGLATLRESIAAHHRRTFKIDCSADDVLVGPGSKELMFLLQLVYYGDLVVPTPTWVSYVPQAQIIGRHVHLVRTRFEDGWRLTAEQLDFLCRIDPSRPRIVVLNYPSNPTGITYSRQELKDLAEVAHKYRLIILSDEIYGQLHHQAAHESIVPYYPKGTIVSGGLSKWCGAGGWRLGFFVFPRCMRWLQDAMAAVASETYTSTCAPVQYAAIKAFEENPEIDHYSFQVRRILRSLGQHLTETLTNAGARVIAPEGGFYLFPDFSEYAEKLRERGITTSTELCRRLLSETGVAVLPGQEFGQPPEQLSLRIAYVNFDGTRALKSIEKLPSKALPDVECLRDWCPDTLQAIDHLIEWITKT